MPNSFQATRRPIAKTIRQLPKKAMSSRESTGGRDEKRDIVSNSSAGTRMLKTKADNRSAVSPGHLKARIAA